MENKGLPPGRLVLIIILFMTIPFFMMGHMEEFLKTKTILLKESLIQLPDFVRYPG